MPEMWELDLESHAEGSRGGWQELVVESGEPPQTGGCFCNSFLNVGLVALPREYICMVGYSLPPVLAFVVGNLVL